MNSVKASSIKIYYDGITKRCPIPSNYDELKSLIQKTLDLPLSIESYNITYKDEEEDNIVLENEYDLRSALNFVENSKCSMLKLHVVKKLDYSSVLESSIWKQMEDEAYEMIDPFESNHCLLTREEIDKPLLLNNDRHNFNKINFDKFLVKRFFNKWKTSISNLCDSGLLACPFCVRKFNYNSYHRHLQACSDLSSKKREAFVSKRQRIINYEHLNLFKKRVMEEIHQNVISPIINPFHFLFKKKEEKISKPNWRHQSKEFRNIIHNF